MDPIIASQLDAFARRWRGLVLLRGLCGGLITFLAALTVAALVDWLFVLPEPARLAISGAVYLSTALVVWFFCVRLLLRVPDSRQVARLVEKAAPDLREDLLSAVELGQSAPSHDSPEFRQLVQAGVSDRLRDLQMDSLLPPQLIAVWLRGAAIAVAIVTGLFFVPGLRYERLVARALAPAANLERVSLTQLRLVEPADIHAFHAQGDSLPIVVEVTGPEPDKVVLESFPKDAPREQVAMPLLQGRQYGTTLPLGGGAVEFRIRARDAMTGKFQLRIRPRPHVARFDKVFHSPDYTKLPPRAVSEENGDLTALEGSRVDLTLHLNQPVREASISIEAKSVTNRIQLPVSSAPTLTAQVPVIVAATYRVQLVAAETGFENKFSPVYEIRPLADLVPRVVIESPRQDFIARSEEVVTLLGAASDDVGLAKVFQLVQINDGPWAETLVAENAGTNAPVSRRWDLLQLGVSPGDRVHTKLAAVDLKGSRAESATLHVVIGSAGFDTTRLAALDSKRALHDSLSGVVVGASELRRSIAFDAAQKIRGGDPLQRQQVLAAASKAAAELERHLDRAAALTREALKSAPPGREAADLTTLARALSELRHGALGSARSDLDRLSQNKGNAAADNTALNEATRSTSQLADNAALIEGSHRDLLAGAEADALIEHLGYLAREQDKINTRAAAEVQSDPQAYTRLARRQAGAVKEAAAAEDQFGPLRKHAPRGIAERAGRAQDLLKLSRVQMEKAVGTNQPASELLPAARNLQRGVELAATELRPLAKELAARGDKAREDLARIAGASANKLEAARKEADVAADTAKKAGALRERGAESPFLDAQAKRQFARADEQMQAAIQQLKDRATAEELRRDTDAQFTADLTKAAQALDSMRAAASADMARQAEALREMERSVRTLEGGRQISELNNALGQLARAERWEKDSPDAASGRTRDWEWASKRLQSVPKEVRAAGLPEKATKAALDASRHPLASELDREMLDRQMAAKRPADASAKLDKLADAVQQARNEAEPALAEARSRIDQSAPRLSEMMSGLARAAQEMEKATRAVQQPSGNDAARDDARRLAAGQDALNKQVDELQQAVRRDANVQDLATPAGRERSRDADDAIAMLREPPPKAQEALAAASALKDAAAQKAALTEAAAQQQKLGESLHQMAQHYAAMEAGRDPAATRAALRRAEEELGVKDSLDRNYDTVQKLNELMQKSDRERLTELEDQLRRNNAMRQELGQVGRETLEDARAALASAAQRQADIPRRLAEAARGEAERGNTPAQIAQLVARARRLVTNDLPPLNRELSDVKVFITSEINRAQAGLNTAISRVPADLSRPPEQLARSVGEMIPNLQVAATEMQTAANRVRAMQQIARTPEMTQGIQSAQPKVAHVAGETAQLVALAQQLAAALTNRVSPDQAMARAATEQMNLANEVAQAGADIQRAGRHESRLGTPQGEALQQIGRETAQTAQEPMRAALDALGPASSLVAARQAMETAQRQLEQQNAALARALNEPPPLQSAQAGPPTQPPGAQVARTNRVELPDLVRELTERLGALATNAFPAVVRAAKEGRAGADTELERVHTPLKAAAALAPTNFFQPTLPLAREVNAIFPPLRQATNEFVAATNKLAQAAAAAAAAATPQELVALRTATTEGGAASAEATDLYFLAQRVVVALLNPNDPAVVQRAVDASNTGREQAQRAASGQQNPGGMANNPGQPPQGSQAQGLQPQGPQPESGQQQGGQPSAQHSQSQQPQPPAGQQSAQQRPSQPGAQQPGAQQSASAQPNSQQGHPPTGAQQPSQPGSQGQQSRLGTGTQSSQRGSQSGAQPDPQQGAQQGAQPSGQQASAQQGSQQGGQQSGQNSAQQPAPSGAQPAASQQGSQQGSGAGRGQGAGAGQGAGQGNGQSGSGGSQGAQSGRGGGAQGGQSQGSQQGQGGSQGQSQSGGAGQGGASFSPTQSRWMARGLDQLDAQMNPPAGMMQAPGPGPEGRGSKAGTKGSPERNSPGPPGGSDGTGGAASKSNKSSTEALQEAMKSQKSEMMSARAKGSVPGESGPDSDDEAPGSGTGNFSPARGGGAKGMLPGEVARDGGDWGRLPPKVAQGLAEGQREGVAGEFRQQVELYFKVVAEKARERK